LERRKLLTGLGLTALMAPALLKCSNPVDQAGAEDTAAGGKSDEGDVLFVHSAQETTLADGVLRLGDIGTSTIYFSDRPERIAGQLLTEEFVANWGHGGDDSFEADPPNATISILSGPEPQEIVAVRSLPRLEDGALIYDVQVLEGNEAAVGEVSPARPTAYTASQLVI
jgi:hypothetical protein